MHAISILWAMVFCFGCTIALASLERVSGEVPHTDAERVLRLDGLAPLVARGARASVVMTVGLVGLLSDSESGLELPLWIALLALSFVAVALTQFTLHEVGTRLIRVRRYVKMAARATLGTGVFAFVEASLMRERGAALLLCAGVILLAASRVTFVLASATNDLVELSGD